MIKSRRNKFGLILLGLVLLILAIALHILYSLRLSSFHFNVNRLNKHYSAAIKAYIDDDYVTAETHCKDALKEAEKKSPENEHVAYALQQLGFTYMVSDRYDDAEAAFQRAVTVAEKVYGPESQDMLASLIDLTRVYIRQRKFKEASEPNQRALNIVERGTDQAHTDQAKTVRSMSERISSGLMDNQGLELKRKLEEIQSELEQNKER